MKQSLKELKTNLSTTWETLKKSVRSAKDDFIGFLLVTLISWLGTHKWEEVLTVIRKIECGKGIHSEPLWVPGYWSYHGVCAYCNKKITPHHFEYGVEGPNKQQIRYSDCKCTKMRHPVFHKVAGYGEIITKVILEAIKGLK